VRGERRFGNGSAVGYTCGVTELVLVRHAETAWNAEGRWQGQTDVPLSDRGRGEVARVSTRLKDWRFDRIVSSDLVRAMDTARGIARDGLIEPEPALREMHLGAWCGLFHREVVERFPDQLRALQSGDEARIGGTGETVGELAARVTGAIDRIARETTGRVLVVTHGGVVRALLLATLGLSGRARPLVGSRNTAITRVAIEGGARVLLSYNDARHLDPDPVAGEERIVGALAQDAVASTLGIADRTRLAPPSEHAETVLVPHAKQLVRYAV